MYAVSLKFQRIFDVVRVPESRYTRKHTLFGFQSDNETQYGVMVPGWPELSEGHTVTVLLGQPNNWQAVLGWRNRSTGELTGFPAFQSVIWAATCLLILLISMTVFSGEGSPPSMSGKAFFIVWLSFHFLMTIVFLRQWLQRRSVFRYLQNLTCR